MAHSQRTSRERDGAPFLLHVAMYSTVLQPGSKTKTSDSRTRSTHSGEKHDDALLGTGTKKLRQVDINGENTAPGKEETRQHTCVCVLSPNSRYDASNLTYSYSSNVCVCRGRRA